MTATEALAILRADNPAAPLAELTMYAEAFVLHRAASANIQRNGALKIHERTGAMVVNPHQSVVAEQMRVMLALQRVRKTDRLWGSE
jgi:phage terminase small subunit